LSNGHYNRHEIKKKEQQSTFNTNFQTKFLFQIYS
jgi:hypothetical protein